MSWFQLDPESIAARVRATGTAGAAPSLGQSLARGTLGFTVVSVAGFAPWAVMGRWMHQAVGEAGMYVACLAVFLVLSGLLLHGLIIGPGSLARFYKLFGIAFGSYAAAWIGASMTLRGNQGGLVGLGTGTAIMAGILVTAFEACGKMLGVFAALLVLNIAGYFGGGVLEVAAHGELGLAGARAATFVGCLLRSGVGSGLGYGFLSLPGEGAPGDRGTGGCSQPGCEGLTSFLLSALHFSPRNLAGKTLRRLASLALAIALCGCRNIEPKRVVFSTPAEGISQITVRSWKAPSASVIEEQRATIEISGLPALAANGYHDPEPGEHEKPAAQMPFEFSFARYGSVAIISSKGEVAFPQHHYCLDAIEIHVPKGMQVMRERQKLATPGKKAPPGR